MTTKEGIEEDYSDVVMVTISILTYNRISVLKKLLLELKELRYNALEIIVVDNCSVDGTQKIIENEFQFVRYFRSLKNIGAEARNIGLKEAKGDIIITLDDDISNITDEEIRKLVKIFKVCPKLGAINFKVINFFTGNICNWVHHCDPLKYSEIEFKTYEITEGAVAFNKIALKDTGYYPEDFFLSHEGPDLSFRLIDNGYDVIYSNAVTVLHSHSDLGRKNWLNYYYDTRNQLWLAVRHFPVIHGLKYLFVGLLSMMVYSIRDGFFKYWLKGIYDGIKGIKKSYVYRKVLKAETMATVKHIDGNRPNLFCQISEKLFKKGIRL